MMTMLSPSEAHAYDPLIQAGQHVAEAEGRSEHQIGVIANLLEGTRARASAEHVLREIERTVVFSRMHRQVIQNLLV